MPIDSVNSNNGQGVGTLAQKPTPLQMPKELPQKEAQKPETEPDKARELYQAQKEKKDKEKEGSAKGSLKKPGAALAEKIGGKMISGLKATTAGFYAVYGLAFTVALINDLLDYLGFLGSIPLIGDLVDGAVSIILWPLLGGLPTLFTLIEFIPFADLIPTYTIVVLISFASESFKRMNK